LNQKEGLYKDYKMEQKEEQKIDFSRSPAVKTTIKNILQGTYLQEKDNEPNYLLTTDNQKIYRLNLMAIILTKERVGSITNFLVDDGTGSIILRSFEENVLYDKLDVGDSVLIIGKTRTYNQEKYVSPEIIKKINSDWLKLRAIELKDLILKLNLTKTEIKKISTPYVVASEISEERIDEVDIFTEEIKEVDDQPLLPIEKILKLIKDMDQGQGVLIEEIIASSKINDTEKMLERMLEKGEIFQNSPGKVKVL